MKHEREQDIQKAISDYLTISGFVVFKHHSTGTTVRNGKTIYLKYGEKGISDLIACSPQGQFWAIEVKKKGGAVSDEQKEFIRRVTHCGGKGFVAYSIDDVIAMVAADRGTAPRGLIRLPSDKNASLS